jgi:3-oxoacyl-[acyl-carrier-protein] synthase-3
MSRHADWTDRKTCVLFGDGAGSVVVTKGDALKYLHLTASGNCKILNLPSGTGNSPFASEQRAMGHLHMDGQEVFKFAVGMAEKELSLALDTLGLQAEDIDHFLIHQANKRIIDAIRARSEQPEEKFPLNVSRYGNISSATLPVLLDECLEAGKIKKGDALYMTAFGAGLTTGACVMVWE